MKILKEQRKFFLVLCFIAICVAIAEETRNEEKPDEVKNQLEISRTIQTEDGGRFDCIDIKSQPAFDHPLLRNHSIQMEPSSYPMELGGGSMLPDIKYKSSTRSVSCPSGTIPIWRGGKYNPMVNLQEQIQKIYARNMTEHNQNSINVLAGLTRGKDMYRTRVSISVYDPEIYGTEDKSGGFTIIVNGDSYSHKHTNAVGVGWFVWKSIGGDKAARFHIFYNVGTKHCFDLQCPGFVQINPNIPLGGKLSPVSKYNGRQAEMNTYLFQDKKSNWWLTLGKENTVVGYWPSELFTFMKVKGVAGYWGGIVEGPTIIYKPPPMGSGHLASEGYGRAAYVKNIIVVNGDYKTAIPRSREFVETSDHPKCYTVANKKDEDGGVYANWGGPGDCKL